MCTHIQEAIKVPIPPQLVIGSNRAHIKTHQELAVSHVSHDPLCHDNPPSNLPYENLKHRRKNKYLATSQEVAHFEF